MSFTLAQLRYWILQISGRLVGYSFVVNLGSKEGEVDYAAAPEYNADLGEQSTQIPVRKLQWFGFRSKPLINSEMVYVAAQASTNNKIAIAADNIKYGRNNLVEGESQMFCKTTGTEIYMDKDGQVTLSSAASKSTIFMDKDGQITISAINQGSTIKLDTNGNISIVPKGGSKVQLGDNVAGNLDAIVLFSQLKVQFDDFVSKFNTHTHSVVVPAVPATVTSVTPSTIAATLTSAVTSSNVLGKK